MRSFFFAAIIVLSGCQGDPPHDDDGPSIPRVSQTTDRLLLIYGIRGITGDSLELSDTQSQLLETQLKERLDPDDKKGINARVRDKTTLEIVLPADLPLEEQEHLRHLLSQRGFLEFRVIANAQTHQSLIKAISEATDPKSEIISRTLGDGSQVTIGKWVQIARGPLTESGQRAYKYVPRHDIVRDAETGKLLSLEAFQFKGKQPGLELARHLESRKIADLQVLVLMGDDCHLTGAMISSATSLASDGQSGIDIHFTSSGAAELAKLTGRHKPNPQLGTFYNMAVILDNQILTAPRIMEALRTERALITGHFTATEVEEIAAILRSGSLPKGLILKFRDQQVLPVLQP